MIEIESDDADERPLPRTWLPDPAPADNAASWRGQRDHIVAAAEPALYELRQRTDENAGAWLSSMGSLWTRAAAGLAVAATVLLVIMPARRPAAVGNQVNVLEMIAADGTPAGWWRAYGFDADPVLALIAAEPPAR